VRGERGPNLKWQIKTEIDLSGKTENQLAEDRSKGEIRDIGEEGERNTACRQTPRASPAVALTGAVSQKVASLARGRRKLMLQQMLQPAL
jgi:hypothetical protein